MTEQVLVEDRDGVRTVTWNRPDALNAMTIPMWNATRDALDSAMADGVRCIVLTGTGRAFTVGQDLAEFGDPGHAEPDGGFRGVMRALSEVDVPLVAAVNGLAVGFGLTVVPWCDVAFAAPEARFRAPFVELGVTTEAGASVALADVVGPQAAAVHLLTGDWLSAGDAERLGLVWRVIEAEQLAEEAAEFALRLAAQPPDALRTTTRLLRERRRGPWQDAVEREYAEMARLAGGEENIAAITRFFERRSGG
jgi:enoyl-CoA hydratase/carnithine racemase